MGESTIETVSGLLSPGRSRSGSESGISSREEEDSLKPGSSRHVLDNPCNGCTNVSKFLRKALSGNCGTCNSPFSLTIEIKTNEVPAGPTQLTDENISVDLINRESLSSRKLPRRAVKRRHGIFSYSETDLAKLSRSSDGDESVNVRRKISKSAENILAVVDIGSTYKCRLCNFQTPKKEKFISHLNTKSHEKVVQICKNKTRKSA